MRHGPTVSHDPARFLLWLGGAALAVALTPCAFAAGGTSAQKAAFVRRSDVQAYIGRLVRRDGFQRASLEHLFSQVRLQPSAVRLMRRPPESMPWHDYRRLLVTTQRIRDGVAFRRAHRAVLARAQARYGVAPSVVTAILGIETDYGKRMGSWPVFDTLATLGFDYPSRANFFRHQLTQYLLLARAKGFDPLSPKGSYAGAMGLGQFMPSAYLRYGVVSRSDGRNSRWNSDDSAILSVANYLARNGWRQHATVAVRARVVHPRALQRGRMVLAPKYTLAQLRAKGIEPRGGASPRPPLGLIRLQGKAEPRYWLTGHDFYVIMSYNPSPLYAMAVYRLAEAMRSGSAARG